MGTIADKLQKLITTKADIKSALIEKGVTDVTNEFDTYGDAIRSIETGGAGILDYTVVFKNEDGENLSVFSSKSEYPIIVNPPYTNQVRWLADGVIQTFPLTAQTDLILNEEKISEYYGDGSLNTTTGGYNQKLLSNGIVVNDKTSVKGWSGNLQSTGTSINGGMINGYLANHGTEFPYPRKSFNSPLFGIDSSNRGKSQTSSDGKVKQITQYPTSSTHNPANWNADATTIEKTIVIYIYCCSTSYSCSFGNIQLKINGSVGTLKYHVDAGNIYPLVVMSSFNTYDTNYFRNMENLYNGGSVSYAYPQGFVIFTLPKGSILQEVGFSLSASYSGNYSDSITFASFDKDVFSLTMIPEN